MHVETVARKGHRVVTNLTVGGTAVLLIPDNLNRKSAVIQNQGSGTVFIGDSTVATSGAARGYALFAGHSFTDDASDQAWWAVGSGSDIVHVEEVT